MKRLTLLVMPLLTLSFLASCGGRSDKKKDFTDIVFNSTEVTYDSKGHTITPTGVPSFAHVTYDGELEEPPTYINVGAHDISVKVTADGYNDYAKTATLTIKEGSLEDIIQFEDKTIEYDGESHTLVATGIPEGATVKYTPHGAKEDEPYPFKEINEKGHAITLDVDAEGYEHYNYTAKLYITPRSLSGVTFESKTITYDGQSHTIEVKNDSGFDDLDITYNPEVKDFTEVGEYEIKAIVKKEHYKTLNLEATLTITKADYPKEVTFKDKTFEYDGAEHSVIVTGDIPEGTTITYTREGYTEKGNIATDPGIYEVTAHLKNPNYTDKDLTATLTIENNEVKRNIYHCGGTLYFQNTKDYNRLYALRDGSSELVKVSNDNAIDIVPTGNSGDEIAYIDNSSLLPAIKYAKDNDGTFEALNELSRDCRYLQVDTEFYYYAVNGPTIDQSGIYKLSRTGQEIKETRLYQGNAYFLQLVENNIYFASGADKVLSYINKDREDQEAIHIQNGGKDVKIKNLSYLSGALYYTGEDGVYQYTIASSNFNKLTNTIGVDFLLINNDLYYVAADGSLIYGSTIRKVDITSGTDSEVISSTETSLSSLTSDGAYLYYYDADKLMRYKLADKSSSDLLADFTPSEPEKPAGHLGQVSAHDDVFYYIDAYDDDTLHSYNPENQHNTRLTSNKVVNYSFAADTLYVNTVMHSPNDIVTYALDLNLGSATLFNNVDAREVVSDGNYLYYRVGTSIYQSALDGSNPREIFKSGTSIKNFRIVDNKLYFANGTILKAIDLKNITVDPVVILSNAMIVCFDIGGGHIYCVGVDMTEPTGRHLMQCQLDGSNLTPLVKNTDIVSIKYYENADGLASIYYFNHSNDDSCGSYYVPVVDGSTYTPIKLAKLDPYFARTFDINDDGICFSDYSDSHGKMHTYYYDFSKGEDPICIDWGQYTN